MNPSAPLAVRFIVTALALAFATLVLTSNAVRLEALGGALLCIAIAALPWVYLDRPNTFRSGLGLLAALAFFLFAAAAVDSARIYPQQCDPTGYVCQLENVLHRVGGRPLAAAPCMLLGLGVLVLSLRTLASDRRSRARPP